MTIGRSAVLTRVHKGRAALSLLRLLCQRSLACITSSYFSSLNSTLPAAMKTGKLTVRPYSVVAQPDFRSISSRRVTGVRVIDGQTKKALEFQGRIVFVCAATLESTRILLNSATAGIS